MSNFFPQKKFAGLGGAQQGVGLAPHRRRRPGGEQVKKTARTSSLNAPSGTNLFAAPTAANREPCQRHGATAFAAALAQQGKKPKPNGEAPPRGVRQLVRVLSFKGTLSLPEGWRPRLSASVACGLALRLRPPALRSAFASPFGFGRRRFARLSPRFACRKSGRCAPCLRRGRRTFSFVMVYRSQSSERFLTVFAAPVGLAPDMELCSKLRKGSAVLFELARIKQYPQAFLRKKLGKNLFVFCSLLRFFLYFFSHFPSLYCSFSQNML